MARRKTQKKEEIKIESPTTGAEKYLYVWLLLAVLVLTVLIYLNALRNGFIYFDDPELVINNLTIRQISFENLIHYFTTPFQYTYLPVGLISYAIDYQIGGLNPFVYHLDSLMIHLLTVVLVFGVFQALTKNARIAVFVAAFYAIHPINVDNVDWIATRNNLLATFFYMIALLSYSFYITKGLKLRYLALACLAFIFSVFSKSASVVLPLTLFLWDYFHDRKWDKRLLMEKTPFFVVSLILGVVTLNIRTDALPPVQYNLLDRLIVFCWALVNYAARLFFPLQLSMSYAYPMKEGGFLPWQLYLSPIILVFIVWGLYRLKVSKKVLIVGLLFFFFNIFLSQSVMLIDNYMANRYAGLPYLGLLLILAEFSERVLNVAPLGWKSNLKLIWVMQLLFFVAGFSFLTYNRNFVWMDTITLFDDVLQKQPGMAWAYNNRGIAEFAVNANEDALKDFNQALALNPDFTLSYFYRGVLSSHAHHYQAALADLDQAIFNDPNFDNAYLERARVKMEMQDNQGAMDDVNQAISLNEYLIGTYLTRGMIKNNMGDYQSALADFDKSILYDPNSGITFYMRSIARRNLGDQAGACADAAQAVKLGYQPSPGQVDKNCQ